MSTAAPPRPPSARTPRRVPRPPDAPPRRRAGAAGIRWDRVARVALLAVLGVVLTLYVSPLSHWLTQSRTADGQRAEVERLQREHDRLSARARALRSPGAIEREARQLGMVRLGERAYVVELP